jgi:hypothetical protein
MSHFLMIKDLYTLRNNKKKSRFRVDLDLCCSKVFVLTTRLRLLANYVNAFVEKVTTIHLRYCIKNYETGHWNYFHK